jgi:hypothetical protein
MRSGKWTKGAAAMLAALGLFEFSARASGTSGTNQEPTKVEGTRAATGRVPAPSRETNAIVPSAQAVRPAQIRLPPQLAEILRLAQAGASDDMLAAYIRQAGIPNRITPDQILYLSDLGVSSQVLTALVESHVPVQTPDGDGGGPGGPLVPPGWGQGGAGAPPSMPPPEIGPEMGTVPPEETLVDSGAPDYSYFYDALSPYGTWLELPGAGWCWQPAAYALNSSWRPYWDNGSWIWTDAGWYWNSGYAWGWGPFHYGRWWKNPRYGWLWRPDRAWGPAWVCWRLAPGWSGWAPLPPSAAFSEKIGWTCNGVAVGPHFGFGVPQSWFTFAPLPEFAGTRLGNRSSYEPAVGAPSFDRTLVNNDLVVEPNHGLVNRGVDPQRVEAAMNAPLSTVPWREVQTWGRFQPGAAGGARGLNSLANHGSPSTGDSGQPTPAGRNPTQWSRPGGQGDRLGNGYSSWGFAFPSGTASSELTQPWLPPSPVLPPAPTLPGGQTLPNFQGLPGGPFLPPAPGTLGGRVSSHPAAGAGGGGRR